MPVGWSLKTKLLEQFLACFDGSQNLQVSVISCHGAITCEKSGWMSTSSLSLHRIQKNTHNATFQFEDLKVRVFCSPSVFSELLGQ